VKVWQQVLARGVAAEVERADPTLTLDELIGILNDGEFIKTSWGNLNDEELVQSVSEAYKQNGPIFALILARLQVFSQAKFQWTRFSAGNPQDFFGTSELTVLERPWVGGTTADLLSRMEVFNSTAGNAFVRRVIRGRRGVVGEDRLILLRPEWMTLILGSQEDADHPSEAADTELLGYAYRPQGDAKRMQIFLPNEVAHYAPIPDPDFHFAGMSWITPVLNELKSDDASEVHKRTFFKNAATPNMAIKFDPSVTIQQMKEFKAFIDSDHTGRFNAWKTLYLGGGADPVVLGKDFKEIDFSAVQGKGESRLASAAGVPPSWVGFSEGLQGSALNAGNFTAARRRFGDGTMHHLWASVASALEVVLDRPPSRKDEAPAQLWHDIRSIPFLREDSKDHAATQQQQAVTMRQLIEAGFDPASVTKAITESDWSALKHTGLVSVQLQKPGQGTPDSGTNPNPQGGTDA